MYNNALVCLNFSDPSAGLRPGNFSISELGTVIKYYYQQIRLCPFGMNLKITYGPARIPYPVCIVVDQRLFSMGQ
jgi:hypothetical protein